jgi:hypothetical protein
MSIDRPDAAVLVMLLAVHGLFGCASLLGDFDIGDASAEGNGSIDATGLRSDGALALDAQGGGGTDRSAIDTVGSASPAREGAVDAPVREGGQPDGPPDSPALSGQCELPQLYSQACRPCIHANCCSQEQACARDPSCSQYAMCILGCDQTYGCGTPMDNSCQTNCTGTYSAGYYTFNSGNNAIDNCVFAQCGRTCETSCFSQ